MLKKYFACSFIGLVFFSCSPRTESKINTGNQPVENFSNITLEMSLKPFKKNDKNYIRTVCQTVFEQWSPLLKHADTVSVMLWTADGSEILDYSGRLEQTLEWSKYIGNPNTDKPVNSGPPELTLHERAYTYMENPPVFTYKDLKFIVKTIKEVGHEMTGKAVRIGETFDPGPEFAKSTFKYERHPEICMANTLGTKSFVCCYATLDKDEKAYAAYPDGIPQGEPLGRFLGKQTYALMNDIGFDYIWMSNGFGFGMETWNTVGAIFDGKTFHGERMEEIQKKIIDFWTLFREACPGYRIETRGTNLSAGIDLARDGVDLRSIYNGNFDLLPPPNSPWAALDGDFGLELTGYMSRMAELPDERFLFRFYIHDPWWANSPWLDRYNRETHDIYLPMSVARINAKGEVKLPSHLNILTIDNSYGNMPDQVPSEVIPHLLYARQTAPDKAGPLVWIYPFDEYHDYAFNRPERLEEIFFGDWFIRQALNEGFPVNTVVSTRNFTKLMNQNSPVFNESVLVTVVPQAESEVEKQLINFVEKGGKLIVYGPAAHASPSFLDRMNIRLMKPVEGEFTVAFADRHAEFSQMPSVLYHDKQMSAGGIETVLNKRDIYTSVLVKAMQENNSRRDIVIKRQIPEWKGGMIVYVRGTNSASCKGGMLLSPDNSGERLLGGSLMRYALEETGYSIRFCKPDAGQKSPVTMIARHDNGFYFSGYVPDQTVELQFRFPQGAPVFTGYTAEIKNGRASYRFPKSWNKECRVFVLQDDGLVSCQEVAPVEYQIKRKLRIKGLKNATVRIYPGQDETHYKAMPQNNEYMTHEQRLKARKGTDYAGNYYEYFNMENELIITW
jgi:hypothetical protein